MSSTTGRTAWALPLVLSGCLLGAIVAVLVLGNRVDSLNPEGGEPGDADPSTSLIFVEVEERIVSDEVTFRVNVRVESETQLLPQGLGGVVTAVFIEPDTTIEPLRPLLEINGRPLFLVEASFPFYRDIGWRDTGPDVEALQSLLNAAGHPVTVDGDFGPETQAALSAWYAQHGYEAPSGSADARTVTAARDTAEAADRAHNEAKRAKTELVAEKTRLAAAEQSDAERLAEIETELRAADRAVDDAKRALARARTDLAATLGESRSVLRQSEIWAISEPLPPFTSVSVEVGTELDPAGQELGTRRPDQLMLIGDVAAADALLLEIGQIVEVLDNVGGEAYSAAISDLEFSGEGTTTVVTLVMPGGSDLPADRSFGVRTLESEGAQASTAVPVTAVGQTPDGEFFVLLETDDGPLQVPVTAGASARGWVAVEDPSGQVAPGGRVAAGIGTGDESSDDS